MFGKRLTGDLPVGIATGRFIRNGHHYDVRNGDHFNTKPTREAATCAAAVR